MPSLKIELPFLKHYLKGSDDPKLPEAYVFETGTNQWRRYDSWPPKNVTPKTLYLQPGGRVTFEAPANTSAPAYDEYVSDPAKPVLFIPNIAIGMTNEHMLDDQRFASSRTDVLVYATEPLTEDAHDMLQNLSAVLTAIDPNRLQENYNDALFYRDEVREQFHHVRGRGDARESA